MIAYISQVSLLISLKDTELHLHGKSKPTTQVNVLQSRDLILGLINCGNISKCDQIW